MSLPSPSDRPTQVRWLVFALACAMSFTMYLHRYMWTFIAPELEKEGWTVNEVFQVYILFNVTYGLGQIPSSALNNLLGPHVVLPSILIVWSLVMPLQAVRSVWGICTARLLFGGAQAGCYPILAKVTRAWFPPTYRTIVQGWIATFFGRAGGAAAPIIMASLLMGVCGLTWRMSLVVLSLVGLVLALAFIFLFRSSPDVDPRVNDAERTHIQGTDLPAVAAEKHAFPWRKVFSNPNVSYLAVMQLLAAGVDTLFATVTGKFFLSLGTDLKAAGLLASLPLIGGMTGGILGAMLNDRLRGGVRSRVLSLGAIMGAVLGASTQLIPPLNAIFNQFLNGYWEIGESAGQLGASLLSTGSMALLGAGIGLAFATALAPIAGNQRWGRSSVALLSNIGGCAAMLVCARQQDAVAAGIALFTVKFFSDMSQPTQWGACTDIGGRHYSSDVFAVVNTAGIAGGIVFPLCYGMILAANTTKVAVEGVVREIVNFAPLWQLAALMYLGTAACWLLIDCTRTLDREG